MWNETPTAPYSLKTFFSCWVLLGFFWSSSLGSVASFPGDLPVSYTKRKWWFRTNTHMTHNVQVPANCLELLVEKQTKAQYSMQCCFWVLWMGSKTKMYGIRLQFTPWKRVHESLTQVSGMHWARNMVLILQLTQFRQWSTHTCRTGL